MNARNHLVAVLALLCCACLTLVTSVAADAITIGADAPNPTSTCRDNPNFRHKKKESKSCEWVASHPKKNQLCSKKRSIKKNCPVACDSCNELKATCPNRETSRKFKADSCAEYEAGLDCGFRHVWTGCHDTMMCTPTVTYSCNENSNDASKEWFKDDSMIARIANNEMLCIPQDKDEAQQQETKPYHYGEGCDPEECPPFAPPLGSSCEWYKGSILRSCYYDYRVTGCTDLDLECSPTLFASCDTLSQTWQHAVTDFKFCPLESQSESQTSESEEEAAQILVVPTEPAPPLPIGKSCDPLTFSHCPYKQPDAGSPCTFYEHQTELCKYGWTVLGCTQDDFFCASTTMGSCTNLGEWASVAILPPPCPELEDTEDTREELSIGETCDPLTFSQCPYKQPDDGSPCTFYEDQECFYEYAWKGCSSDTLKCTPSLSYTCKTPEAGDGMVAPQVFLWEKQEIYHNECIADDRLWGTECDP